MVYRKNRDTKRKGSMWKVKKCSELRICSEAERKGREKKRIRIRISSREKKRSKENIKEEHCGLAEGRVELGL